MGFPFCPPSYCLCSQLFLELLSMYGWSLLLLPFRFRHFCTFLFNLCPYIFGSSPQCSFQMVAIISILRVSAVLWEVTVGISIYLKGAIRNILHFYATECAWMCVLPQQCQNTYEKAFTFFPWRNSTVQWEASKVLAKFLFTSFKMKGFFLFFWWISGQCSSMNRDFLSTNPSFNHREALDPWHPLALCRSSAAQHF